MTKRKQDTSDEMNKKPTSCNALSKRCKVFGETNICCHLISTWPGLEVRVEDMDVAQGSQQRYNDRKKNRSDDTTLATA